MVRPTLRGTLNNSARYHADAARAIAGSVNSNVRLLGTPICFARASGAHLVDIDGNSYIDYALGMGPAILGHAHPRVVTAVQESLSLGQLYAGQHPAELELALLVQRLIPSAELVRFGMTGSEMIQAALRVARAHTGRNKIIKFEGHYHGWFDNVLANVGGPPAAHTSEPIPYSARLQTLGQPQSSVAELLAMPWNNIDALTRCFEEHGHEIAAVLMEPMMCNAGAILPRSDYLQAVRRLCDVDGALLVFDEVITGFRLGLGGAQGLFGVKPDLSVFAKAIGAGLPLAMLTGRADIMKLISTGAVNHSGTYNSNLVSIAAGVAALQVLSEDGGSALAHIERTGRELMSGLRELACKHESNLYVSGVGAVFNTSFTDHHDVYDYASFKLAEDAPLKVFLDGLLMRGVRPTSRGTWFVSAAHTDREVRETLAAADEVLGEMERRIDTRTSAGRT